MNSWDDRQRPLGVSVEVSQFSQSIKIFKPSSHGTISIFCGSGHANASRILLKQKCLGFRCSSGYGRSGLSSDLDGNWKSCIGSVRTEFGVSTLLFFKY